MMLPGTIPNTIGTIGNCRRLRIYPSKPKTEQIAQSTIEFLSEYTPTNVSTKIQTPRNRVGIRVTFKDVARALGVILHTVEQQVNHSDP